MSKSFCFNNKRSNECCNNVKIEPKSKSKIEDVCNKCLVVMAGQIGPIGPIGPQG